MRIISGRFKAKTIDAPKGVGTRPTTDRVRESLFNVLEHGAPGALVEAGGGAFARLVAAAARASQRKG